MSRIVRGVGIPALLALLASAPASAGVFPVQATLDITIGGFSGFPIVGAPATASSDGVGGAATLPPDVLSGMFEITIAPPLLGIIDAIRIASSSSHTQPASNVALSWNGTSGTMGMNASAYLLMGGLPLAAIPLGVVGVGGTSVGHISTLVAIEVYGNPYQLGVVTLMGALNGENHTVMATGYDARTPNGAGTLVMVSPIVVSMGVLGSLAGIATLTLELPEPGGLALLGLGTLALGLVAARRR